MKHELTGWQYFTGWLAKSIMLIAFRINNLAALSLALQVADGYNKLIMEEMEYKEEE